MNVYNGTESHVGSVMQHTIELPDQQAEDLERLAAQERRSLGELVQLALGDYLARRTAERAEWAQRFHETVERIQARIPPDVTSEEIEADITAASEEYRAERAASSASPEAPDAGRH